MSLSNQINNTYGINKSFLNILEKRLEIILIDSNFDSSLNRVIFGVLLNHELYRLKWIKSFNAINICILDFIWSYKGYRHIKGLPVHGQRTWSNGWSTSRSNFILRSIRARWAFKYYGNITLRDAKFGLYAEYNNSLWKRQWRNCWFYAKKRRLSIAALKKKNNQYHNPTINIKNMAAGYIFLPSLKKELTKKQKSLQEQSIYAVGYPLGFSKVAFLDSILQRSKFSKMKDKTIELFKHVNKRKLQNQKVKKV